MSWRRWFVVLSLLAGALWAGPAHSAPPIQVMGLTGEITIRSGDTLTFQGLCVAERCAICRDLVTLRKCANPLLQIKYHESDTSLPLRRVRAIDFHEKAALGTADYFPATFTLDSGKKFEATVRIRKQYLAVTFCGLNDIGTVSCLPADKIKRLVIK